MQALKTNDRSSELDYDDNLVLETFNETEQFGNVSKSPSGATSPKNFFERQQKFESKYSSKRKSKDSQKTNKSPESSPKKTTRASNSPAFKASPRASVRKQYQSKKGAIVIDNGSQTNLSSFVIYAFEVF